MQERLIFNSVGPAIIPVRIGNPHKTGYARKMLLKQVVCANPILYPAVSKKDARIRMSLSAIYTTRQLDKVFNAFEFVDKKLHIGG